MYVHSKSESKNTSAVLNDLGFYVLSKMHKWPHLGAFKKIPKVYITSPHGLQTYFWPEIRAPTVKWNFLLGRSSQADFRRNWGHSSPQRATTRSAIPASV